MAVEILLTDLTSGTVTGTGIFDKLMQANKAHLEAEYAKGRIKGPEYATVYLGALNSVMANAMQFLLQKKAIGLQADLLEQQILLAQVEVTKAEVQMRLMEVEVIKANAAVRLMEAEILNAAAQRELLVANKEKIAADTAQTIEQTTLIHQQKLNAVVEGTVLVAQECKLRAEYDLTMITKLKTTTENELLGQKVLTEKAQTQSLGVDDSSVIGTQKRLYVAQTDGFKRDAEQKAAQLLISTWNSRRMTDEGTVADGVNMLNDATLGRAVNKVLAGIGA